MQIPLTAAILLAQVRNLDRAFALGRAERVRKYTPHQGSKEMARRVRQAEARGKTA